MNLGFLAIGGVVVVIFATAIGSMILVNVSGSEVGIVERRLFGQSLPEGRVVAMSGEIGYQARSLQPGLHVLVPALLRVTLDPMTVVGEDEVGIVESIDGRALEPGHIFARRVAGHDNFQDGEAFLRNGGQKGAQVDTLPPGKYRINTYLFHVHIVPVLTIPSGKIGVVSARDGTAIPAGRLLAQAVGHHDAFQDGEAFLARGGQRGPQIDILLPGRYRINPDLFLVEVRDAVVVGANQIGLVTAKDGEPLPAGDLVAAHVDGHNDFQDGSAFLGRGGQRGPQLDLLKPGQYYLNPLMFAVQLDETTIVNRGEVAVLVSNVGLEPERPATEGRAPDGKERYVVEAGYRGIQADVVGPGAYYLNRWAYIPYVVPTTNVTIDWADDSSPEEIRATASSTLPDGFDPLSVISRDGFEMRVSVKVIIRVRPDQAPLMVAKIGSLENLVCHVVHPMVDSSFRNQASSTEAMRFMQDRALEQAKAEDQARVELEKYHVECVSVLISQIILPQDLIEIQTRRVIAAQQQEMYVQQRQAEERRIATTSTRATADKQPDLVAARIGAQIAEQTRQKTITEAEGQARAIEIIGDAEGKKILAVGGATAQAYQQQVAAVGRLNLTGIEVAKAIAEAGLKITPDILVGSGHGDGSQGGLFAALVARMLARGGGASEDDAS